MNATNLLSTHLDVPGFARFAPNEVRAVTEQEASVLRDVANISLGEDQIPEPPKESPPTKDAKYKKPSKYST